MPRRMLDEFLWLTRRTEWLEWTVSSFSVKSLIVWHATIGLRVTRWYSLVLVSGRYLHWVRTYDTEKSDRFSLIFYQVSGEGTAIAPQVRVLS